MPREEVCTLLTRYEKHGICWVAMLDHQPTTRLIAKSSPFPHGNGAANAQAREELVDTLLAMGWEPMGSMFRRVIS